MSDDDKRTPAPQGPPCTVEWHEALKLDEGRWTATTVNRRLLGEDIHCYGPECGSPELDEVCWCNCDDCVEGAAYLEWAECARCNSTLARPVEQGRGDPSALDRTIQ